ncbi:MAG: hypothetical protein JST75_08835 [Bacteroidetes bacterium]|nr:hypothetical protein [Bacteroidota bacterium]
MPSKINITGYLLDKNSNSPVPGLKIEAWDKDLVFDDFVGSDFTDPYGKFKISFTEKYFRELFFDRRPDLYFKIYMGEELIASTEDDVLWNIDGDQQDVIITIDLPADDGRATNIKISFSGSVKHQTGNPIPNIGVAVVEKNLRKDETLKKSKTDKNGNYSINIDGKNQSVYAVQVIVGKGEILADSGNIYNAAKSNTIDLVVSSEDYRGDSIFLQLSKTLARYKKILDDASSKNPLTANDVLVIAYQQKINPLYVWYWLHANELEQTTKVNAEVFFGWFQQGLPTDLDALLPKNADLLKKSIQQAADQNFITQSWSANADTAITDWNKYKVQKALGKSEDKSNPSLGDILSSSITDPEVLEKFLNNYASSTGTTEEFWKNLDEAIGEKNASKDIQLALQLTVLTGNQPVLTQSLINDSKQSTSANPIETFAAKDADDWTEYINRLSKENNKSIVPEFIKGDNEADRVFQYANTMASSLESAFPTPAFFGRLHKEPDNGAPFSATKKDLGVFIQNNPDFDFKTSNIYSPVNAQPNFNYANVGDKTALISDLKSVQRLMSYTPSYSAINTLKRSGLDAAHKILQVPKEKFVKDHTNTFGSSTKALNIYYQAEKNFLSSAAVWANWHPHLHSTAVTPTGPDLTTLFGSEEACECEDCTSVFGAAAYFADCMHFIYSQPAIYNELVRRRPDLPFVKLSCENANTPLPYVDLVIELLEKFVLSHKAVPKIIPDDTYQTTWQAEELAANPQYLDYDAYAELLKAVYTNELPFNFPLKETRVYLRHLGIQRHLLMSTFYGGTPSASFDEFIICLERLGISPEEGKILTGETSGDGTASNGTWNFYGFDTSTGYKALTDPADSTKQITAGTWVDALSSRIDIFLQQTGLVYKDLLSLLLCDFINPFTTAPQRKISIVAMATDASSNPVPVDTCELDLLMLNGLLEADLTKIHRFLRLWKRLGWTMFQLDKALKTFGITDFNNSSSPANIANAKASLKKIFQAAFIQNNFQISVEESLAFWGDIDTSLNYIDFFKDNYPVIPSLYEKLFRSKLVLNPIDPVFTADATGLTGVIDGHTATLFAAAEISDTDYGYLLKDTSIIPNNNLTIGNLSSVFRHSLLARKLNLSIKDYLSLKALLGIANPFADPVTTFTFITKANTVADSGFTIDELNYLLRDVYLDETQVAPVDDAIGVFLSNLRAALRAIKNLTPDKQKNTIVQKFSEELKITTNAATLLLQTYLKGITNAANPMVEEFWSNDFETSPFLQTYKDITDPSKEAEPEFVKSADGLPLHIVVASLFSGYRKMDKVARFINRLTLSDAELEIVLKNAGLMQCTDLVNLPLTAVAGNFDAFDVLSRTFQSRDILPAGVPGFADILQIAINASAAPVAADKQAWIDAINQRTNWGADLIQALTGTSTLTDLGLLKYKFPQDFCNGGIILELKKCVNTVNKIGLKIDVIASAVAENLTSVVSQAVKNAAKAKYDEAKWLKIAKPLRDDLREKQRKALVAFVVTHSLFNPATNNFERWKDSAELYQYLLMDVEMKPINVTSRIKQAICSVQLFIDRVLMNLEYADSNPTPPAAPLQLSADRVKEWNTWRKVYRIWEADRRIFLYPENWIDETLRDNKSPIFTNLETLLQQNELTEENIEFAFSDYLEKLDEVSRLEVVGLFYEDEAATSDEVAIDRMHVIARTYANPQKYFYRYLEFATTDQRYWTPWQRLEIDVDGDHLVPLIYNRRLCLFWLFFTQQSEPQGPQNPSAGLVSEAPTFWKIQIAWSEFKNGKWNPKKVSKNYIESVHIADRPAATDVSQVLAVNELNNLKAELRMFGLPKADGTLDMILELTNYTFASNKFAAFLFNDTTNDPSVTYVYSYNHTHTTAESTTDQNMMLVYNYTDPSEPLYLTNPISGDEIPILDHCKQNAFKVVLPACETNPFSEHFFFQDGRNTFYVEHTGSNDEIVFYPGGIDISVLGSYLKGLYGLDDTVTVKIPPKGDPETYFTALRNSDLGTVANLNYSGAMFENLNYNVADAEGLSQNFGFLNYGAAFVPHEGPLPPAPPPGNDYRIGIDNYYKTRLKDRFLFTCFYHPYVRTFIHAINKNGIDGLLKRPIESQSMVIDFKNNYSPTYTVRHPYPDGSVEFGYDQAYSQYNWELFFHAPMLIATKLSADQQFEKARTWYHYIFNPTNNESGNKERFWQFRPFYDETVKGLQTLTDLLNDAAELQQQIDTWKANPFNPHAIARMRLNAYMKYVVMSYIDNLINWGDQLFRRDTIEAINEATNLYILAGQILGNRPQDIPPRAKHADTTFDALKSTLNDFTLALVDIETFISPSISPTSSGGTGAGTGLGQMFDFCVPRNENLLSYWDRVADRLFKIRNSMNIEGLVRTLPLYEPPIDPALLVRAAAAGIDLSSILSDIAATLPNYRFTYMLQKANELVADVKSLGSSLLQALEKRDAEQLALLRSTQEQKVLAATLVVKSKQVDDAKASLDSVNKSLENASNRFNYYSNRPFTNTSEKGHLASMQLGTVLASAQGGINLIAGVLSLIPNLKVGVPFSIGATFGGDNLAALLRATSEYLGIIAGINSAQGAMMSTLGGYQRRQDDWQFQAKTASIDIEQLTKQVLSSSIKLDIATKELENQQLAIENASETDEFMRRKFTNQNLYDWMVGQIASVYFQSYQLAYDLAKKAEQCYHYELAEPNKTTFVQFGYWDSLKKGLLSAEKLQYDLRRMEAAYVNNNTREFELTKHISLLLLDPIALLDLKRDGICSFVIPEALFDLDYNGHGYRKIKSISISIPCVAGPYTTINCTLTLLNHTIRTAPDQPLTGAFISPSINAIKIATSSGQNDNGMFELNFRDERYLPFEGCGVATNWQMELTKEPKLRMIDYDSISDVVVHVRYTARDFSGQQSEVGGTTYEDHVTQTLLADIKAGTLSTSAVLSRPFSLKHEFPSEYYRMFHPSVGTDQTMQFEVARESFPFFAQDPAIKIGIQNVHAYGFFNDTNDYTVQIVSGGNTQGLQLKNSTGYHDSKTPGSSFVIGNFTLKVFKGTNVNPTDFTGLPPAKEADIRDIFIVLEYKLT